MMVPLAVERMFRLSKRDRTGLFLPARRHVGGNRLSKGVLPDDAHRRTASRRLDVCRLAHCLKAVEFAARDGKRFLKLAMLADRVRSRNDERTASAWATIGVEGKCRTNLVALGRGL